MRTRKALGRRLVVPAVAMAVLGACGGQPRMSSARAASVNHDASVPSESLRDWVTYADAVVIGTVEQTSALPISDEEREAGEGYISRRVRVRIDDIVWRRHTRAPTPPAAVTFITFGWTFDGDRRDPSSGGPIWLQPGKRYVIPLARWKRDGWAPFSAIATLQLDDRGRVAPPDGDEAMPWETRLSGRSAQEAAQILAAIEPDPSAPTDPGLDPEERMAGVLEAEADGP